MKILTLVWSIGIGGTERAAVNYAISYKMAGIDSRVLVLGEGFDRREDLVNANVPVIALVENLANGTLIIDTLKSWQPDIIHIHNFSPALVEYIKKIKGDKTKIVQTNVFSRADYSPEYKIVDASLQLSQWGLWKYQRLMKDESHVPVSKVVPYLVLAEEFAKPEKESINNFLLKNGIPQNSFVIGRIGQPLASKWNENILKVIEKTVDRQNNIYYLFVGLPATIRSKLAKYPSFIKERVKLIDEIKGDENLSIFYYSLDVFAHISKIGESFGYVLTEAMICEVPVITLLTPFKDNGQFEVVGNGIGGFCVTNETEFIDAIEKIYGDKELQKKFKISLKEWVITRFSPEVIMPSLIKFYENLLNRNAQSEICNESIIHDEIKMHNKRRYFQSLIKLKNSPFTQKIMEFIR